MRKLNPQQTHAAIASYGLTRPKGIGFAFRNAEHDTLYDWHCHDYHQLAYAMSGAMWIETEQGRHVLPSGRAAWIPARLRHRTLTGRVDGTSLYFDPKAVADAESRLRILTAPPLMREMILYAMRWPLEAADTDPVAVSFFSTLALLCRGWLEAETPLFLPRSDQPAIMRAMDYAMADPAAANQAGAIAAAHLSERSFRRLFVRETGTSWQAWVAQLRLLHALDGLIAGQRVTDVAMQSGYASLSAFAKAFRALTGESPSDFRKRRLR
jgi:AraC-like DNA-binding protein